MLRGRLRNAVRNLNPGVPEEYLDQAIGEVITPKSQSAIAENRRIHQILVEGYRGIEYIDHEGNVQNPTIYFLSSQPHKNDYLSLNQVTIANLDGERRFDVVCYVNGMPLAFIELKKTGANTSVEGAHNQLQTYVKEFGMAFRFANIVIPSDDLSAKYGTPFTPWNHFAPWNVDEDGSPVDPTTWLWPASRSRSWTCCLMVCLMWSVLDSSTATSRRLMTPPKAWSCASRSRTSTSR